jgi:hypothetical protein
MWLNVLELGPCMNLAGRSAIRTFVAIAVVLPIVWVAPTGAAD